MSKKASLQSLRAKLVFSLAALLVLFGFIKFLGFSTEEDTTGVADLQSEFENNYNVYALDIPGDLNFAGEPVPIEDFEVMERIDRELLVNTYWQSQGLLFIKRSNRWFPVIEPILEKNGVPDDFKYLALIESGFMNVISPAGATGFWQFMKPAGEKYGLEINNEIDERYHVEKSTEAACKYLKEAYTKFGSWTMAAASYNMGIAGLQKQVERQKVDDYYDLLLNIETGRYIFRTIAVKEVMSNPTKYGFNVRSQDQYQPVDYQLVELDTAVADFADFAHRKGITYKTLKVMNPWLRENYLTNADGKSYFLKIPTDSSLIDADLTLRLDTMIMDSLANIDSLQTDKRDSVIEKEEVKE